MKGTSAWTRSSSAGLVSVSGPVQPSGSTGPSLSPGPGQGELVTEGAAAGLGCASSVTRDRASAVWPNGSRASGRSPSPVASTGLCTSPFRACHPTPVTPGPPAVRHGPRPYTNSPRCGQTSKCIPIAISRAGSGGTVRTVGSVDGEHDGPEHRSFAPPNRPLGEVNSQASIAWGLRDRGRRACQGWACGLWPLSSALDPESQSDEPPPMYENTRVSDPHGPGAMYRRAT